MKEVVSDEKQLHSSLRSALNSEDLKLFAQQINQCGVSEVNVVKFFAGEAAKSARKASLLFKTISHEMMELALKRLVELTTLETSSGIFVKSEKFNRDSEHFIDLDETVKEILAVIGENTSYREDEVRRIFAWENQEGDTLLRFLRRSKRDDVVSLIVNTFSKSIFHPSI